MKHIAFLNPRLKRRRSIGRRGRARRNPALSAAHRAKISRAVKASMRKRKSSGGSKRKRATSLVIRRPSRIRTRTKVVTRFRNRRPVARRSNRRRRSGGGLRLGSFNLKSVFNKDNLTRAGGIVLSSFVTSYVLRNFGQHLPAISNPWARIGYAIAIPVAGAYAARRISPRLAEGLLLGGLVTAVNAAIMYVAPAATNPPVQGAKEYLDAQLPSSPPSYDAINAFGASPEESLYASPSAFASDAWSRH